MKKFRLIKNKDLALWLILLLGVLALVAKLVLCSAQRVYIDYESALDDMLMYNQAVSITQGNWLGGYDYLTLSKHSFFSLWVAILHWLGIPFIMGNQLLWGGAALAAAWAVFPVLRKKWLSLLLYCFLLFSPATVAGGPGGFTQRIYRDSIFPAICLLCIACIVGYALRYAEKPVRNTGWLVLAGLSLGAAWLTREDGWWMMPFIVVALLVVLVFILRSDVTHKLVRCATLLIPFVLLGGMLAGWAGMNYSYYGRFIISDFSSGEFADAYGAMTRIQSDEWEMKVAVPSRTRALLYENCPSLAELEPYIESRSYQNRYDGMNNGGFYWALREAASECGHYNNAQKAQEYWAQVAKEVNVFCDSGKVKASGPRSSVSPPIRMEYVEPTVKSGFSSFWDLVTFRDADARNLFSQQSNDPAVYGSYIAPMETFLHQKAHTATKEYSAEPYYNIWQQMCFKMFDIIRTVYIALLPAGIMIALIWQVLAGVRFFKRLHKREKAPLESLLWITQLGVLGCAMLRMFMVSFVMVSSFSIGDFFLMYYASATPLLILYAFVGVVQLVYLLWPAQKIKTPEAERKAMGVAA